MLPGKRFRISLRRDVVPFRAATAYGQARRANVRSRRTAPGIAARSSRAPARRARRNGAPAGRAAFAAPIVAAIALRRRGRRDGDRRCPAARSRRRHRPAPDRRRRDDRRVPAARHRRARGARGPGRARRCARSPRSAATRWTRGPAHRRRGGGRLLPRDLPRVPQHQERRPAPAPGRRVRPQLLDIDRWLFGGHDPYVAAARPARARARRRTCLSSATCSSSSSSRLTLAAGARAAAGPAGGPVLRDRAVAQLVAGRGQLPPAAVDRALPLRPGGVRAPAPHGGDAPAGCAARASARPSSPTRRRRARRRASAPSPPCTRRSGAPSCSPPTCSGCAALGQGDRLGPGHPHRRRDRLLRLALHPRRRRGRGHRGAAARHRGRPHRRAARPGRHRRRERARDPQPASARALHRGARSRARPSSPALLVVAGGDRLRRGGRAPSATPTTWPRSTSCSSAPASRCSSAIDVALRAAQRTRHAPADARGDARGPARALDAPARGGGRDRARQLLRRRTSPTATSRRSSRFLRPDDLFDRQLADVDRALFLGHDPAALLHGLLGTGVATHVLSTVYAAFIVFLPLSLGRRARVLAPPAAQPVLRGGAVDQLGPRRGDATSCSRRSARSTPTRGGSRDLPHSEVTRLQADAARRPHRLPARPDERRPRRRSPRSRRCTSR